MPRIGDQVPYPLAAERQHEQGLHENEAAERVAAGRDCRLDRLSEARIRDIGAEEVNVEHAPGIEHERRFPQRRETHTQGRIAPSQPADHNDDEAYPDNRDDKRKARDQHAEPGKRSAIFGQAQRPADQQILPGAPLQADDKDRIKVCQQK